MSPKVFPSEAWAGLDAEGAAAAPVASVAAGRVFALTAAFVAGAAARFAAFSPHWPSVAPTAGDPAPAFAGASVVPGPASRVIFLVPAGISGPPWGSPYLADSCVQQAEYH